jgi:hypothetical protein
MALLRMCTYPLRWLDLFRHPFTYLPHSVLNEVITVTTEEEARYTAIIDAILETADLTTVTRKKIRMGLERALGGKDLSPQKVYISILLSSLFADLVLALLCSG